MRAAVQPDVTTAAVEPPVRDPGDELAPGYEVIDLLSRGESLDVYDVWSEERCCRCTAKELRPDRREHARVRRRLVNEGRLLQRLTHPHLVRGYELIEQPHPIVILETLTGETLSYAIESRARRMPASEIVFLGLHLCSAIGYLHRQGHLHLDLKPSNVICVGGLAKVIDLSLAAPPGWRRRGAGTRGYMAPEQARGGRLDESADVWGIGAVLYDAATGRTPFEAETGEDYAQLARRAEPVGRHRRLPPALATAIDACLAPERRARPGVEELATTLDALTEYGRRGIPDDGSYQVATTGGAPGS